MFTIDEHRTSTMRVFFITYIVYIITFNSSVDSAPQAPEINDQFEESNRTNAKTKEAQHAEESKNTVADITSIVDSTNVPIVNNTGTETSNRIEIRDTSLRPIEARSFMTMFYVSLKKPIVKFIETPKVNIVLRNIGTCVVNGAMEIVSYYFPTPLIPLIATAASMLIPFEPIVLLKNRMPVTSYRRAFNSAVDSFMGTFDRFKTSEEDPYMTRRFNRRFMGDNSKEIKNI